MGVVCCMRQQGGMKASTAWSPAAGLNVVSVERGDQAWTVTVDGGLPPACPRCGALSNSRHSTYSRTLRDLSAQGAPVIVRARLGRWRCRNLKCDRRIFAERLPGLAAPLSRQTSRLAEIVRLLGHSAGGRPSERLMRRLGMPVSDTTILASLKHREGFVGKLRWSRRPCSWRRRLGVAEEFPLRHDHRRP